MTLLPTSRRGSVAPVCASTEQRFSPKLNSLNSQTIYRMYFKPPNTTNIHLKLAVKVVPFCTIENARSRRTIARAVDKELDGLFRSDHNNVMSVYSECGELSGKFGDCGVMVLKRATCDLHTYLWIKKPRTRTMFTQLAKGLLHMHEHSAHLDLKPANVLLYQDKRTKKWTMRLADFGLAVDANGDVKVPVRWDQNLEFCSPWKVFALAINLIANFFKLNLTDSLWNGRSND